MLLALQYKLCQQAATRGNTIYATNKIAWQMILLPRHDHRGNNIRSLTTNKITWQCYSRHDTTTVAITYDLSQRIKLHGK